MTTWPEIHFKGHYHGNKKSIRLSEGTTLFTKISESIIGNLLLSGGLLAGEAENKSTITACETDVSLIEIAKDCSIKNCHANYFLIKEHAINCNIAFCHTNGPLIKEYADHCTISDCLITLEDNKLSETIAGEKVGGISKVFQNKTIAERCFVIWS